MLIGSEHEVVLPFPVESVGVIFVSDPPNRDGHHLTFDLNVHNVRQAQGRVVINDDEFIGLELSEVASKDLSFLGQLPSNSLESLKISGAHLGNEQMRQINRSGVPPEESPAFSTVLPPAFACSVTSPICGDAVRAPLGTPVFARS